MPRVCRIGTQTLLAEGSLQPAQQRVTASAHARLAEHGTCTRPAVTSFDVNGAVVPTTRPEEPRGLEAVLGTSRGRFDRRAVSAIRAATFSPSCATAPEKLTPEDFRLRPDSAGYRAGKDGKDLGADVDLVGPGPAYERWKKTPEYQQWLKDTKQVTKAEAPKAEPKAFVLLGGKGVEVRKFDTLAEAVQGASDGDTIEIRGNGPFVTRADHHQQQALDDSGRRGLPAGDQAESGRPQSESPAVDTQCPLVLEGLELQWVGRKGASTSGRHALVSSLSGQSVCTSPTAGF